MMSSGKRRSSRSENSPDIMFDEANSPVLRRRFPLSQVSAVSPVLKRKTVVDKKVIDQLAKNTTTNSPILGQKKNWPLEGRRLSIELRNIFSDIKNKQRNAQLIGQEKHITIGSPLCERKNFSNVMAGQVKKSRKMSLNKSTSDKENTHQNILRKSGRTKKATSRYQAFKENIDNCITKKKSHIPKKPADLGLETSTPLQSQQCLSDGNICEKKSESLDVRDVTLETKTRSLRGRISVQKQEPPPCAKVEKGKKSSLKRKCTKSKAKVVEVGVTIVNCSTNVENKEESCSSAKSSNVSVKATKMTLKKPVDNAKVGKDLPSADHISVKGATCAGSNSGAKSRNSRALRSKDTNTKLSKVCDPMGKMSSDEAQPEQLLGSVQKIPRATGLEKRISTESANLKTVQASLSKKKDEAVFIGNKPEKKPVWASETVAPMVKAGKRKSLRINSDVFDFSPSPTKDVKNKRKRPYQRKPRVGTKKLKSSIKTTLITDPEWENPLVCQEQKNTNSATCSSVRSEVSEYVFDPIIGNVDDAVADDRDDADVYDRDDGYIFDRFEGGTTSLYVPSRNTPRARDEPSVGLLPGPTPYNSKFLPNQASSTPRTDLNLELECFKKPATVKDDIAQCFGFENDSDTSDTDDDGDMPSPVKLPGGQHSLLNQTVMSDVTDINTNCSVDITNTNRSGTQPFRFTWGTLRPGTHSYSSSRSMSMITQGRSKNNSSMASGFGQLSHSSRMPNNSISVSHSAQKTQQKSGNAAKEKSKHVQKAKRTVATEDTQNEKHEVSMLFDEEPIEDGDQGTDAPSGYQESQTSTNVRHYLSKEVTQISPEKSFTQHKRKSYDRDLLEKSRKDFEREYGGSSLLGKRAQKKTAKAKKASDGKKVVKSKKTNSKAEDSIRRKNSTMLESKVVKSKKTNSKAEDSIRRKNSTMLESQHKKKHKPKKECEFEKSAEDWASGLNNHFNQIDDSILVVA